MTREEILKMESEELSQKVAEEIMGECYHRYWDGGRDSIDCLKCGESRFYHQRSQAYSTDISVAWLVVEKLGMGMAIHFHLDNSERYWEVRFIQQGVKGFAKADTAPEAICKAALLAKLEAKGG